MYLTKSKYVEFVMCPRKAWFNRFAPLPPLDEDNLRGKEGERVGILARDFFGKDKWVLYDENNPTTKPGIYAEYLLQYGNLKCYCDILIINENQSIDIYEVKSVNDGAKDKYLEDVSFQYYVSKLLNLKVNSVNLMTLNKEYVFDGETLELDKLFKYTDLTEQVIARLDIVEQKVKEYFDLDSQNIPTCPFSPFCKEYGGCQYINKCKEVFGLPEKHSIYELYDCDKRKDYISAGLRTWEDIYNSQYYDELSNYNKIMIEKYINQDETIFVLKDELKEFVDSFEYPIYFFDFETCQEVIPVYKNSSPYAAIPFQYSLHILRSSDSEVIEHKYFLGNGIDDPREELVKQMIDDLGESGTIVAYHMSYEKGVITQLMKEFPQYENELSLIKERFKDLENVFSYQKYYDKLITRGKNKGTYKKEKLGKSLTLIYHPSLENSNSIKYVLPAFFPGRKDLNYGNLSQVHNGTEAMSAYKKLRNLTGPERDELIDNMLKYCHLDTLSMVVLYLKYKELSK